MEEIKVGMEVALIENFYGMRKGRRGFVRSVGWNEEKGMPFARVAYEGRSGTIGTFWRRLRIVSFSTSESEELTTHQKLAALGIQFTMCYKCGTMHPTRAKAVVCCPDPLPVQKRLGPKFHTLMDKLKGPEIDRVVDTEEK